MPSFTTARKICGPILVLIMVFMVLKMFGFGSSSSAQKRSSNCRCSLPCDEAEAELKKHESVEVHVQHQSVEIYNERLTVSSLFDEKESCSVVVLKCLQEHKEVEFRIFADDKKQPFYIKMDLKPECDTEKPPEKRNKLTDGEDKTHSTQPPEDVKITGESRKHSYWLMVTVFCVVALVGVFLAGGYICWREYRQRRNII